MEALEEDDTYRFTVTMNELQPLRTEINSYKSIFLLPRSKFQFCFSIIYANVPVDINER